MNSLISPKVVIVGGGTAGVTVAARLRRRLPKARVAIIEPSSKHYYQPLWTLVGAGVVSKEVTERDEANVIPRGAEWVQDSVVELLPDDNAVKTKSGEVIEYDFLVVAAGIQIDWNDVKGLPQAIGKDGVCSNYDFRYAEKTWEFLRQFPGGNAIFTVPHSTIKCGGAPQKILYLAEDYLRRSGTRDKSNVIFASPGESIFAIPKYRDVLEKILERKEIETRFQHNLVEIRAETKEAIFEHLGTGKTVSLNYEFLHITPPMSAPSFIKASALANKEGWVDVDKFTLQHTRYANVFSLGDASSLPTAKTGAAVRKQAPVLVKNLIAANAGKPLEARYQGYTSCPIVTGYGKLILAEFDYDKQPVETFPFNQAKERFSMYLMKKYLLPLLYWYGMLKGRV